MEAEPSPEQPPPPGALEAKPSHKQQAPTPAIEGSGAALDSQTFTPVVDTGVTMKVGYEFDTPEAAFSWYNDYAKQIGFSTKINSSKKNSAGVVIWKAFACSKEGKTNVTYRKKYRDAFERSGERRRYETRCGCQARMHISKKQKSDMWTVNLFEDRHNHPLATPSMVHMLRSHRKVSATKKALMKEHSDANIPSYTQISNDANGPSSTDGLDKDIYNCEGALKVVVDKCDAQSVIYHFENEKEKNDGFFYCYDTDDDGSLTRCFWVDSDSRNSYPFFGDAILFYTVHSTNKYGWYLAPFVGVNHHRQTKVFGCGLINQHTSDSFVWLFSKFLEAMPYHTPPGVFITDQDAAITLAVARVFPNTAHHHCLWHILKKFPAKMNLAMHGHLHRELVAIIMDSETPEEFERLWTEKTVLPELAENTWLSDIYAVRHRWVPAYVKQVFSAGMLSNQRVESNHSVLKRYVDKRCSLSEVVTRITAATVHLRHNEMEADLRDLNETPRTSTAYEMEKQMATTYTKTVFGLFQKQFEECPRYICQQVRSTDNTRTYEVRLFALPGETVEQQRELTYNISSDSVSCSCRMFEVDGIPCCHMLCWMRIQQVMIMPEQYILRRWTKCAKRLYEPAAYVFSGRSFHSRRAALKRLIMDIVDDASLTEARSNYLSNLLKSAQNNMDGMDDGGSIVTEHEHTASC